MNCDVKTHTHQQKSLGICMSADPLSSVIQTRNVRQADTDLFQVGCPCINYLCTPGAHFISERMLYIDVIISTRRLQVRVKKKKKKKSFFSFSSLSSRSPQLQIWPHHCSDTTSQPSLFVHVGEQKIVRCMVPNQENTEGDQPVQSHSNAQQPLMALQPQTCVQHCPGETARFPSSVFYRRVCLSKLT